MQNEIQENNGMNVRARHAVPLSDSAFLKACRCEKTPFVPVWLMRQAGRYMKDYRDLRDKNSFLSLCKNPSLVAEITVTAQEKIKADAAILFSDILLILEPMGMKLEYVKGDGPSLLVGAHGRAPLRSSADVDGLKNVDPVKSLPFVFEGIKQTRQRLYSAIPLLGFAGAPFTLASYMIEGGSSKDFSLTRKFMHEDRGRWNILLKKLVQSTISYLNAQVDAGVDAVQVFDSWVGALSPEEYRDFVYPHSKELLESIKRVPVIHFGTKNSNFLEMFSEAGGQVIGVDHRVSLADAWKRIGPSKAIQGNLDPEILLTDLATIKKEVRRILKEAANRPGYIFNLGHGVLPQTPVENVIALVEMVHEYTP